MPTAAPELAEPDARTLRGLREALQRARYDEAHVAAALGRRPPMPRTRREVYLRRLAEAGSLGTLIRLFRLGESVESGEVAAALAPTNLDVLVEAGILVAREDRIAAGVEVTPFQGLFLAHDRVNESRPAPDWHVMLGAASRTLAALTIRRPVALALDLGTGCGVQALLAARHGDRVVATDVNERAITFSRINGALNGIENVEWRQGDLFAPVEGERFGLIVSNPPFVISPDTDVLFRDSAMPGDEISRHVVHEAGEYLEDGGHATVLCSWIDPSDDHWSAPLRTWIGSDIDAILLQFTAVSPLEYAALWTEDFDRWLGYYRQERIESISTGAVVLRRGQGGRTVAYQANRAPRENASEQLLRVFAAHDELAGAPADDAWLRSGRFRLIDHRLRQEAAYRAGSYSVELTGVEITGAPLNVRVETDAIHVLPRLDGSRTLGDAIDDAARATGLDRAPIEQATLKTVRRLFDRGFLVREGD
jgi:methylase of polypeptide subunit release factors